VVPKAIDRRTAISGLMPARQFRMLDSVLRLMPARQFRMLDSVLRLTPSAQPELLGSKHMLP